MKAALIGILILLIITWIGGGFEGGSRFVRSSPERSTTKFAVEVAGAINSFYSTYGSFPIGGSDVDWVGDTSNKSTFVAILTAASVASRSANPKSINYLDGFKQAKRSARPGAWEDGIDYETKAEEPAIYDWWGQPFKVIMDTNGDGAIANPILSQSAKIFRGKKALVYSTGPPNRDGSPNSDESKWLTSW